MRSTRDFVAGGALGVLLTALTFLGQGEPANARQEETTGAVPLHNAELAKLHDEDQADRMPKDGKPIDWAVVSKRDRQRESRVKALYEKGEIHSGRDYQRAAMVLQHASTPEDFLLAHEFCVVALAKGEREARWLAAATEDRLLMNLARPQRFGTQYRSSGPDDPWRLYKVAPGVTDNLRRELNVPTLAEARERESRMNEKAKGEASPPAVP
ncbi:MAG: hypothetical protein NVSMB9_33590 [Isosphaeraceae bacterium]